MFKGSLCLILLFYTLVVVDLALLTLVVVHFMRPLRLIFLFEALVVVAFVVLRARSFL